ncbi:MAG: hypothetical protein ACRC8S_10690 [Fimbriiglobus sp.]
MKTLAKSQEWYAISVKQPWAALLAMGVKSVEVRTWGTTRRGPLLIHASKIPDERPEAWQWITTPELVELAKLRGGIIGQGELCGCVKYETAAAFVADSGRHLNAPDWYVESGLFGLTFRSLRCVPFMAVPGNTFFFRVEGFPQP